MNLRIAPRKASPSPFPFPFPSPFPTPPQFLRYRCALCCRHFPSFTAWQRETMKVTIKLFRWLQLDWCGSYIPRRAKMREQSLCALMIIGLTIPELLQLHCCYSDDRQFPDCITDTIWMNQEFQLRIGSFYISFTSRASARKPIFKHCSQLPTSQPFSHYISIFMDPVHKKMVHMRHGRI